MNDKLTYARVGDYYIPDLTVELLPSRDLGKYARMRLVQHCSNHGEQLMLAIDGGMAHNVTRPKAKGV